jgi:hypothetical protein
MSLFTYELGCMAQASHKYHAPCKEESPSDNSLSQRGSKDRQGDGPGPLLCGLHKGTYGAISLPADHTTA